MGSGTNLLVEIMAGGGGGGGGVSRSDDFQRSYFGRLNGGEGGRGGR